MKIHPTAVVAKGAKIGEGVEIGPYCVVGSHLEIGRGTRLLNHVVLDGHTKIGEDCQIYSGACIGTPAQDYKTKGVSYSVEIGNKNIIREYVTINAASTPDAKTVIGDRNFLMISCHVAHDCVLGSDITIANGSGLSGHTVVEDHAVIGGMVGVHQFVHIGKFSMTGGCSRIVQDVAPFSLCHGHEAIFRGVNVVGLRRAGYSTEEISNLKKALKILLYRKLNLTNALAKVRKEIELNQDIRHLLSFVENSKRGVIRSSPDRAKEF